MVDEPDIVQVARDIKFAEDENKAEAGPSQINGIAEEKKGMYRGPDDNALIWKLYMEQAKISDDQLASVLNGDLDPLLIFAGLFSAVLSAFLLEVRRGLEQDPQATTNALLSELVSLVQHGNSTGSNLPTPYQPPSSVLWVNGLWFSSLLFSLMGALGASLAKGWVAQYVSIASGTTWQDVSLRHLRFIGITRWHLRVIIQSLPVLIHIAFFLFAIGLVILLLGNNKLIGAITLALVVLIGAVYIGSTLHPVFSPDSPFRMPVSDFLPRYARRSTRSQRRSLSVFENDALKAQALTWLLAESPKESVIKECIETIHTLPSKATEIAEERTIRQFAGQYAG